MNFRDDELVTVQGRTFPVVGGRLRLAHEANSKLSVRTEIVKLEIGELAVVGAIVTTDKGEFFASGLASISRDARLGEALLELAETRAIARALRFAGYGVETCGVEEIADTLVVAQPEPVVQRPQLRVVGGNGGGKAVTASEPPAMTAPRPKGTPASTSQQRAVFALGKRLGLTPDQAVALVLPGTLASQLRIGDASRVIDQLKARAEGSGGNGSSAGANK